MTTYFRRRLTAREMQAWECVSRGLSNKQIARELGISTGTVKTHLSALYALIGAANRTQAALDYRKRGLSQPAKKSEAA